MYRAWVWGFNNQSQVAILSSVADDGGMNVASSKILAGQEFGDKMRVPGDWTIYPARYALVTRL